MPSKEDLAKYGIDEDALVKREREIAKRDDSIARKHLKDRYDKVKQQGN